MLAWSRDFELYRRDKLWTWRELNVTLFLSPIDIIPDDIDAFSHFLLTFNFVCWLLMIIITIVYFTTLSQLLGLHRIVQSTPKFQPEIENKIYQKRFLDLLGCQNLMAVFCILTPCMVIRSHWRLGRNSCFHLQGDWICFRCDWEEKIYLLYIEDFKDFGQSRRPSLGYTSQWKPKSPLSTVQSILLIGVFP
jgi:hypothetical protein